MTEYIIANEYGMYICYDNFKRLSSTNNINNATKFTTHTKAYNVLTCSFLKKKRIGWKVVERKAIEKNRHTQNIMVEICDGVQRYKVDTPATSQDGIGLDWNKIRNTFEKAYSDVIEYKNKVYKQLTDIELELCDCEHACEFFKYNASRGYTLYAMIRERRIKRRYLKNEYKKAMAILNMSYQNIVDGKLERVFNEVDSQSYEPRVLTNLFKI